MCTAKACWGAATAIKLFNSVISLFFLLTTNFIARRISDSSIF